MQKLLSVDRCALTRASQKVGFLDAKNWKERVTICPGIWYVADKFGSLENLNAIDHFMLAFFKRYSPLLYDDLNIPKI